MLMPRAPAATVACRVKFILQITKAILGDHAMRRKTMFALLLGALAMVFAGTTFLERWLAGDAFFFLLYWAACAWLTFAAVLLALFDILVVRAVLRREREALKHKIFGEHDEKK
jgi:energy-converting hydrogenase Eha subunit E